MIRRFLEKSAKQPDWLLKLAAELPQRIEKLRSTREAQPSPSTEPS